MSLGEWDDDAELGLVPDPVPDLDGDPPVEDDADKPQLHYASLPDFVEQYLAPMYRRSLAGNDVTWCPEWWRHAEAIARLDALWRAWEHLRLEPALGMSVWFRDHADPHMGVLLSADGPFKACTPDAGHNDRLAAVPLSASPGGLLTAHGIG